MDIGLVYSKNDNNHYFCQYRAITNTIHDSLYFGNTIYFVHLVSLCCCFLRELFFSPQHLQVRAELDYDGTCVFAEIDLTKNANNVPKQQ